MRRLSFILVILAVVALSACSKNKEVVDPYQGTPEETLFTTGSKALSAKDYKQAVLRYESLASQYPYGPYAEQGLVSLINAYYLAKDYPSAVATADRYLHLYPRGSHLAEVYYLRGLANFKGQQTALIHYFPLNPAQRDLTEMREAYSDFKIVEQRFPDSPYVADSRQHMIYIRNLLARYELAIATYYMERLDYVAAANRASYLIENYPQAPETRRALVILVKANQKMDLHQAAHEALEVLHANYPDQKV